MATMGVGRVIHVERSLIVPSERRGRRIHLPNRRHFLQLSGAVVAGSLIGCSGSGGGSGGDGDTDWSYIIGALAVAAADILGVYFCGVPVGTIAKGAVETIDAAESNDPRPSTVDIRHEPSPSQGMGDLVSYNMPRVSDAKGVSTIDLSGIQWVQLANPHGDDIEHVTLLTADGSEVLPQNAGMKGQLPDRWRPGADLYMVGLPMADFKKVKFQTTSGKTGEIPL